MEFLTKEMVEQLKAPLPPEAISQHPTKTFLSTIKAIYVVERLNDVFGIGQWKVKNDKIDSTTKMIVVKSILTVPKYDIEIENFGGNDNQDLGDAYKGACTDALTKIASYLGIGMDVFKGLVKSEKKSNYPTYTPTARATTAKPYGRQKVETPTVITTNLNEPPF